MIQRLNLVDRLEIPGLQFTIENLPKLCKRAIDPFRELDEDLQQAQTLAVITSLSSLFSRISGMYYNQLTFSNLYFAMLAPPGSGKGNLAVIGKYFKKINDEFILKNKIANGIGKGSLKKGNQLASMKVQVPLIPGNVTSSKFIKHLHDNSPDVPSLLFETEMDTLSQSIKSEHGGFSDLLRKAYHAEDISISRKTDNEYFHIYQPKLSVILSGTPDQIYSLIPSPENGLFSRFLFFEIDQVPEWKDVSPKDGLQKRQEAIEAISDDFYNVYLFYKDRDVLFGLSDSQWAALNDHFSAIHNEAIIQDIDPNGLSVIKRHALMAFKIALVITAVRSFEYNQCLEEIECEQRDFDISIALADISLRHSLTLMNSFPVSFRSVARSNQKKSLFQLLPKEFKRGEALEYAQRQKISNRSLDRWLSEWTKQGRLKQDSFGKYCITQ